MKTRFFLIARPPAIAVVLALYLALAAGYSLATPILEAGDEFWQFFAVLQIASGRGLPVLGSTPDDPLSPEQEAGQPPLYQLAAGLLASPVDASDARDLILNPHADIGIPSPAPDNKNRIVHTDRERFPFQGVTLAVYLGRLLSILLGALAVYLTDRVAREAAPHLPAAAPLAAALVAFDPMFLFVSASVANDSLIAATAALALLLLLRLLRLGPTPRRLAVLSLVLGLVALSKLSGLAMLALAGLVVVWQAARAGAWRAIPGRAALLAVGPLVLAGWWYLRNLLLFGDPTGLGVWLDVVGRRVEPADLLQLVGEARGFFMGYWGVFGAFDLIADYRFYDLYLLLCLAGALGLAVAWVTGRGQLRERAPALALLALWLGIVFVALVRWTQLTMASSGRLLFPAIAATSTLLALGLLAPLGARWRTPAAAGLAALLLALAVYLPLRYVAPAYARPQPQRLEALGQPQRPVGIDFGGKLALVGYDLARDRAQPGDEVEVTLYWQVQEAMDTNYSISVQLLGPDGLVGQRDLFPGGGKLATTLLRPGDALRDVYRLRVAPETRAPIIARLKVVVYDSFAWSARPPVRRCCAPLAEAVVGEVAVDPLTAPPAPQVGVPVGLDFGGQLRLLGYDLPARSVAAGQPLELTLHWQALRRMDVAYTVFVHLADPAGRPVAQHDSQPRGALHPTTWWAAGETVADPVRIAVGPGVPPGRYRLLVGLYDLATMQRLSTADGQTAADLGEVEVRPGQGG